MKLTHLLLLLHCILMTMLAAPMEGQANAFVRRCVARQERACADGSADKVQTASDCSQLKEKDALLSEAYAAAGRKSVLMGVACAAVLVLGGMLWVIGKNLRSSKRSNRMAMRQIHALLEQRDELDRAFAQREETDAHRITNAPATAGTSTEGYRAFKRMERILVERQLFLQPKFGREDLLRATGVGKNQLVGLLRTYAGSDNLNDYLNGLRAEYAIRLMQEQPHLTLDAVAQAAGFNSRSTFYRFFVKKWGMTPTRYLQLRMGE